MSRNLEIISTQEKILKNEISKFLRKGEKYAFLDFPNYANVGDSALWLGGLKLLTEASGNSPDYVCTLDKFDAQRLLRAVPEGPIFLSGGGNFGDIWIWFQDFREMILKTFKGRTVIQLPQSISFSNELAINQCAKLIKEHGDFHLLVRDSKSLEFAQQHFECETILVPDMAFALGPLKRPILPSTDVFLLLREDCEKASYDRDGFKVLRNSITADWLNEPESFGYGAKRVAALKAFVTGAWSADDRRVVLYKQLAVGRLDRGMRLLSSGRQVITDRLHAHILSTLMDIPHIALDNNYGKISGYINSWTNSYVGVATAKTAEDALEKLALLPKH